MSLFARHGVNKVGLVSISTIGVFDFYCDFREDCAPPFPFHVAKKLKWNFQVRFTGGEPTVRKDLADIMRDAKEIGPTLIHKFL